jgi:hypothetical protein
MARALSRMDEKKGRIQAAHRFIRVGLHGPCGPYPATFQTSQQEYFLTP